MTNKVEGLFFTKVVKKCDEITYSMKLNEEEIIKDYGSVEEFKRLFTEDGEFDYEKIKKSKYKLTERTIVGINVYEEFVDEKLGEFISYIDGDFVYEDNLNKSIYKINFELNNE